MVSCGKTQNNYKEVTILDTGAYMASSIVYKKTIREFEKLGFRKVLLLDPGETTISFETSINLKQREGDSLYFEFIK